MSKDQTDVSHIDKGEINEPVAWIKKEYSPDCGYFFNIYDHETDGYMPVFTHPPIKESLSTNIDWLERCIEQTQLIANLHQEIEKLKTNLHNVIVFSVKKICNKCNNTDWVCENHPDQEAHACKYCGGAGMPCECIKKASEK